MCQNFRFLSLLSNITWFTGLTFIDVGWAYVIPMFIVMEQQTNPFIFLSLLR